MLLSTLLQYLFLISRIISCQQLREANIGLMFPIQYEGVIHPIGPAALAAAMMAVDEINRKHDGIEDEILPNTKLKMVVRSPGGVFTLGATAAINMMYRDDGLDIAACIGPYSLGAIEGNKHLHINSNEFIIFRCCSVIR